MPHNDRDQISQQEHELNTALRANGLKQSETNREILSKMVKDYKSKPGYNQNSPENRDDMYKNTIKNNLSRFE